MNLHIFLLLAVALKSAHCVDNRTFPDGFSLGVASSAYQIEGAWLADGKGLNLFDVGTHVLPVLFNSSTGDVACDSYNKWEEDVKNLKNLGVDVYRFSLSWSRILPTGFTTYVNPAGIDYYNELIDALIDNGIEPLVTIFHWDTPITLFALGGLYKDKWVDYIVDYAKVVFDNFGDRVKYWITYNEPKQVCLFVDDTSEIIPGILDGVKEYECIRNVLRSHAKIYELYQSLYEGEARGKVGIVLDLVWREPASDSAEDIEAVDRYNQFEFGIYAHPIFSSEGNYPQVVIDRVANRSALEGRGESRLPQLTQEEVDYIKGSADFLGVNYYYAGYVEDASEAPYNDAPSFVNDLRINASEALGRITTQEQIDFVAKSYRKFLNWVKDSYGGPAVFLTENGIVADGLNDTIRITFLQECLSSVLQSIYDDNVNIFGYTAWSLMDSFEWVYGYQAKMGLYDVDFDDPERPRTPKASVEFYKSLTENRCLLPEDECA